MMEALGFSRIHNAMGSIGDAVTRARTEARDVLVEVEVETLDQLEAALDSSADRVMLDNFSLDRLRALESPP